MDGIHFANGVVLSPNEDFLLVAETPLARILKYNLRGAGAGTIEVFVDGLPGIVDNIEADANGIWVALPMAIDKENPLITHLLSTNPKARQFIISLLAVTESPQGLLRAEFPEEVKQAIKSYVGGFMQLAFAIPPRGTVLRLDWHGNIVKALHSLDGSAMGFSHAVFKDGCLYLGSPLNNYIGRVRLE